MGVVIALCRNRNPREGRSCGVSCVDADIRKARNALHKTKITKSCVQPHSLQDFEPKGKPCCEILQPRHSVPNAMFHKRNRWHCIAYDVERKRKLNYLKEDTTVQLCPYNSMKCCICNWETEIHEKIHNKLDFQLIKQEDP